MAGIIRGVRIDRSPSFQPAALLSLLSQALGQVLQEQRRALPDLRLFRKQIKDREALIAEFGLRRMQHREEYRKLRDLDTYAGEVLTDVEPREAGQISGELQQLLERRHQLTGKLLALEENVLRDLGLAEVHQRHLLEIVKDGIRAEFAKRTVPEVVSM